MKKNTNRSTSGKPLILGREQYLALIFHFGHTTIVDKTVNKFV